MTKLKPFDLTYLIKHDKSRLDREQEDGTSAAKRLAPSQMQRSL
jgi:hypothetical protein